MRSRYSSVMHVPLKPKKPTKGVASIASIKQKAPHVPPLTCHYLDSIRAVAQDLIHEVDDVKASRLADKLEVIDGLIEVARSHCEMLRDSGRYWYDHYKALDHKYKYYIKNKK